MSEIRPMRRGDIAEVAELYRFVDQSDWRIPPEEVPRWLERTLFDHPWVDAQIPSLVYVEDSGAILGFIGSHVRRMRLDGEPIRMVAAGPLIAHPAVRSLAVGARLWRHFLEGPQELTITDGASDEMRQIFELIGGQLMHPSSMAWARVFHPWSYLGNRVLGANVHVRHRIKPWARKLLPLLDMPTTMAVRRLRAPQPTATTDEPLTPELLLEHMPSVTRSLRLVPDYDLAFLRWLFSELHNNRTWGTPHQRLVRDQDDRVLGWYVYFALVDEGCQVLQIAAQARHAGTVLDSLFAHAVRHGGAAVQGRVEAHILAPLAHRGSLFRFSPRSLVHSPDPGLLGTITSGHALLTRLEGEWWMAT
jgi:hypothetical protein